MYVPYSMDETEPDLYGGMGGQREDSEWETQTKWEGNSYGSSHDTDLDVAVRVFRQFNYCYTQDDMTKVIQKNLKAVSQYRSEIEELLGLLSYIYNNAESLPEGTSQLIREQITMNRS